jgi:hypothetical protein
MKTVSFYGSCPASSELTLVSPLISHPFEIKRIKARFTQGSNNLMKLKFFISPDSDAPASGEPNGMNLLADYGQVDYIVGNNDTKEIEHNVVQPEGNYTLKVYANNEDTFEHDIDVQMTIKELERR